MNSIRLKRFFTILLAILVAMAFTVMTTGQADAKSKKKTVYQPTSIKSTDNYADTNNSYTTYITYNANGLMIKKVDKTQGQPADDATTEYERATCGAVKSIRIFKQGKLVNVTRNTVNAKGMVTVSKKYVVEDGKETLDCTTTYFYYKNGKCSKEVQVYNDEVKTRSTITYRKNGKVKKEVNASTYGTFTYTYNKKGNITKAIDKTKDGSGVTTWKYKYDKHKNPVKDVMTTKTTDTKGKTTKSVSKGTGKYKYDKHGNILKSTIQSKDTSEKKTYKSITTYKYKKFTVDKKYLKYMDN